MKTYHFFDKQGKNFETSKTFPKRGELWPYKIVDSLGYEYFSDGSGIGFTAFEESNEDMWLRSWPLYNQKTRTISCIKKSSWHIYWHFKDRKKVKLFHNKVRELIKSGKFKVKNEKT